MTYFKNVETLEELRKQYKELLKQFDAATGDSLNAAKNVETEKNTDGKESKKKKFWK